jgi:DNA helicase-2/ATP-dependent DNA helicase PcrA
MAEERRLMYVGVTRAQNYLYLTRAFRRTFRGQSDIADPSRFLDDIPRELITGNHVYANRRRSTAPPQTDHSTRWRPSLRPTVEKKSQQFQAGQRVRHAKFGEGIVIESKLRQDDEELTIVFEESGIKRLSLNFASLEKI